MRSGFTMYSKMPMPMPAMTPRRYVLIVVLLIVRPFYFIASFLKGLADLLIDFITLVAQNIK